MDLAARMQAKLDRDMFSLLGATATASQSAEPFNLAKLRGLMAWVDTFPPPPVFASSEEYPKDAFWQFERDGCEYVLGHPDLWAKVPAQPATGPLGLSGIVIQDVDVDTPQRRELKARIRFWMATASHLPGQPPKWPKSVTVERSAKARLRDSD